LCYLYKMEIVAKIKLLLLSVLLLPSFFLSGSSPQDSFTIAVGRESSDDGSVMVGHNEDTRSKNNFVNIQHIEENRQKNNRGLLRIYLPGLSSGDSYMNKAGVVITAQLCPSRKSPVSLPTGIGLELGMQMAAHADSARHALQIAGEILSKQNFRLSGCTFILSDPDEVWILHVVQGKQWLARRVPNDHVAVTANRFTIGAVNLLDKENFRGSPDVISYARLKGWVPKDKEFHFALAYSDKDAYNNQDTILRQWRGTSMFAKKKFKPEEPLPFSFKPRKRLKVTDIYRLLRDHYEETKYEVNNEDKEVSPNVAGGNTICGQYTRYSFVTQLRKELRREIGNLVWLSLGCPDANAYSPWYFSITTTPDGYFRSGDLNVGNSDPDYAYYSFAMLSRKVDQNYRRNIKTVRKEWRNYENFVHKIKDKKEKEFDYFLKKSKRVAMKLITNYVLNQEYRKWFLALELIEQML